MDGMDLLREVSEAYRGLQTLALQVALIDETGDENAGTRSERRMRFFYGAPNRIRSEPCGKAGIVQVFDGQHLYTSQPESWFGPARYSAVPFAAVRRLPHLFRCDHPFAGAGQSLLFQGIDEHAESAELAGEADGCYIVSVMYQPPRPVGYLVGGTPVRFWVNRENRIVMHAEGETGHRPPASDEVVWSRHAIVVREMQVNEPLPDETFLFVPPPGAELETRENCGVSMSSGGGFIQRGGDPQHRLEHRGSHEWQGETLIERSRWKMRGIALDFERRLTLSSDGLELSVDEHITGPKGAAQTSCKLPVG